MEDLNFKCGNPGAVQFGNFINYYQFHPPETRIALLPTDFWSIVLDLNNNCYILDLGCNAGDLTAALYEFFTTTVCATNCSILGVDIDPILIHRADEKNALQNITFKCADIMTDIETVREYLNSANLTNFDIVFCFSITMWIHLNHGDSGLKFFLKRVSQLAKILVIEPQPWKCYKTAVKRFKLGKCEFPKFKELEIKQDVENEIERYLIDECNMEKMTESDRTEWGRKLLFFKSLDSSKGLAIQLYCSEHGFVIWCKTTMVKIRE